MIITYWENHSILNPANFWRKMVAKGKGGSRRLAVERQLLKERKKGVGRETYWILWNWRASIKCQLVTLHSIDYNYSWRWLISQPSLFCFGSSFGPLVKWTLNGPLYFGRFGLLFTRPITSLFLYIFTIPWKKVSCIPFVPSSCSLFHWVF